MTAQIYEHHINIKKNKLCPFLMRKLNNTRNSLCNWHKNIEVLLVTDGEGRLQYNSEDLPLSEGDIIVINSGDIHRLYSASGISYYYIIIDESFCRENGIDTEKRCFEKIFWCKKTEDIYNRLTEAYGRYKDLDSTINAATLRLVALELLIDLYDEHSLNAIDAATAQKAPQDYIKQTLDFLAEHYTEPLTLEALAKNCGITKYHLAREFKRYTGQTVITHVNILRCKKADSCLSNGMTVTEAACECGFESISYFSRTYKKLMGTSPSSIKRV